MLKSYHHITLAGHHAFEHAFRGCIGITYFYGMRSIDKNLGPKFLPSHSQGVYHLSGPVVDDLNDRVLNAMHLDGWQVGNGCAAVIVGEMDGLGPTGELVTIRGLGGVNQQAPTLDGVGLFFRVETHNAVAAGFIVQRGQRTTPVLKGGIANGRHPDRNLQAIKIIAGVGAAAFRPILHFLALHIRPPGPRVTGGNGWHTE